ncbi:MAG: hypothetical protein IT302_08275 [Dehalococcoidia bacterium]|nr:hypothetical protein [Dehalococcoidia bacterium]
MTRTIRKLTGGTRRRLTATVLALALALLVPASGLAAYVADIYTPWGSYSSGATLSQNNVVCMRNGIPHTYSWQHSLASSTTTYSSPKTHTFNYLDWYGGWSNLPSYVDLRFWRARIISQVDGTTYTVAGLSYQDFEIYDYTAWLSVSMPWARFLPPYVETNVREWDSGSWNYSCGPLSSVRYWAPGSY